MATSCEIPYIENLALTSREEKDRLTDLHRDISKKLFSHRVSNSGYSNQIFTYSNNKLYVPGDKSYFKEAATLIDNINTNIGFEAVTLVQDTVNPMRRYVSVDVRADKSTPVDEQEFMSFYRNYFGDSDIMQLSDEFVDPITQHPDVFKKLASEVKTKTSVYLKSLEKSGDYFSADKTKKDLTILLGSLKDPSTSGLIESVSKYILTSTHSMNNLRTRLGVITNKINNLSLDDTTRKQQLTEISNFVRQSGYYYHLFDTLEDFSAEFKRMGYVSPRAIDDYERDLLEKDLKEFLASEHFPEDIANSFLNSTPELLQESGDFIKQFREAYKSIVPDVSAISFAKMEQLENDLKTILNKNLKKNAAGLHRNMLNTLSDLSVFKLKLKELHYNTLVEIYYPTLEKTFDNVNNKRSIDNKQLLTDKYKISKEDFKTLLEIAEEDISSHSRWASAMINVNDVVANTIANYFKEVMLDIDYTNKKDINELQDFITGNGKREEDLSEHNRNFVHENLTIENIKEVDDTYIPDSGSGVVEITMFGITKKYQARRTRNFLNKYNNIDYNNKKKVFQHTVDDVVEEYADLLYNDKYALSNLENSSDVLLSSLFKSMYMVINNDVLINNNMGRFMNSNPTVNEIKGKLKGLLYSAFYADNMQLKSEADIELMFHSHGIINTNGDLVDLNDDHNNAIKKHILNNSHWTDYKEISKPLYNTSNLQDRFYFNPSALFGKSEGATKKVLVKYTDLTYGYVELLNNNGDVILLDTSGKEIFQFATYSGDYNSLADKYDIENGGFGTESLNKWKWKNSNKFNKEYFDRIISLYKQSNSNFGPIHLQYREVPQVNKFEGASQLEKAKLSYDKVSKGGASNMIYNYAKEYIVKDNKVIRTRNGVMVDENDNPTDVPVYETIEKQYINGQKVRDVSARFLAKVPLQNLEDNIYKSILLYKTSSNSYRGLKNNESQALLLQSILEGDEALGIAPRKAKVKVNAVIPDVRVPGGSLKYKESDLNSSKLIISFINDYVFNEQMEDYEFLGIPRLSAKKIASTMAGYTAYTALAWNIGTMPSNALISLVNTRAVSKGNEFFNEKHWKEAFGVYTKNYGNFFNDFKNKGFNNQKSELTQLIIRFNAIQGEFLSPQGVIESKDLADKMSDKALFWTQEIVEHLNQTSSMIMLMKGHIIKDENGNDISLWDAVEKTNLNRPKNEAIKMPEYFTKEMEIDFQKKLQGINRQIHGNYSKLDKNDLQRGIFSNMFMMFRKYIYDGFRSRFMEERWDQEIRDEQEGYFRTYLKTLNKEFSEVAKTQGLLAAIKSSGLKSATTTLLKTTLGGWDAAFGRVVSNNSAGAKEFLYGNVGDQEGDITDRQYYASVRATYEIGIVVRAMLIVALAEALMNGLDDDDDELKFVLSYIDIYARKIENDVGFFTSFTNVANGSLGGPTLDQMYRLMRDPFTAVRTMDNTSGIFTQLTDFDVINEDNDFEFSWGALDTYQKSGKGFEKGDFKIVKKLEKSILSPYWNTLKLGNPDLQLSYLDMTFKSSK